MKEIYVGFIVEKNNNPHCYNCNYDLDGYMKAKTKNIQKQIDNFPDGGWPDKFGECPKCKDWFLEDEMWPYMNGEWEV